MSELPTTCSFPSGFDLPLRIDPDVGNQPRQIHAAIRDAIIQGQLRPGLRLPSSRALATQLGIRRGVVVVAYEHLQGDGLIETRPGSGTLVSEGVHARKSHSRLPDPVVGPVRKACALGNTLVGRELLSRLGMATRRRITQATPDDLFLGDPRGTRALREQVAAHLAVSRGFKASSDCVVIVNSMQQGLRLCAEALLSPGDDVWFEDPGYPSARRTLQAAGLEPIPVTVDGDGLDVAAGRKRCPAARAAYVTPSNQFPNGVSMTLARRLALLDWAREAKAWIIEDDYDNEFRYDGTPLTALAGLDGGEHVIYLGTFSKMLFASLRLAYVVVPPATVSRFVAARAGLDRFSPTFLERAVADLMTDGTMAAHLRRVRKLYRSARNILASSLEEFAGGRLHVRKPAQGLHLVAALPAELSSSAASILKDAGIAALLLSQTQFESSGPEGFILGFAGYTEHELREAAKAMGRAVLMR